MWRLELLPVFFLLNKCNNLTLYCNNKLAEIERLGWKLDAQHIYGVPALLRFCLSNDLRKQLGHGRTRLRTNGHRILRNPSQVLFQSSLQPSLFRMNAAT